MMDWEKSPCLKCTKKDPGTCNDKNCPAWQVWFLGSWEKIHGRSEPKTIGQRMAAEARRICKENSWNLEKFTAAATYYSWEKKGRTPTADYLAKLHELGGDVIWVLTGKRGG